MKTDPIVRQIIARDCHVSWSNRRVVRHVISRLAHGWTTYRTLARAWRRDLIRQCYADHARNRDLYLFVMRGQRPPRRPRLSKVPGAIVQRDEMGRPVVRVATCGTCHRSWNDAAISATTPAPSARCPFEYQHKPAR